ncbi:MAG: Gfo/Idh/MocA family protein [Thermomicrobiales bacterium]
MRGSGGVRVGLAGLGRFGKLHASVLSRLPDVEMVAICDPLADELTAVGDQFGVAGRHTDFDKMLATEQLDCLFLVTPEQTHAEMTAKAIAKGLPLFVEKPLATTAVEGERLAAAAKTASVHVQLGFVLRFDVHHALLKAEIAAGRLGDLVTIRVKRNCSKAWFDVYGDRAHSVYETVIHDIDLILWFSQSRCRSVYAVERHITGHAFPDACVAILQLENGTVALIETSWLVPERAPANVLTETWHGTIDAELAIVGTEQSAQLRMLDSPLSIWTDDVVKHPEGGLWPVVFGHVAGALREEDAHFIECVRTGAASTVASLGDAVEGLRIAEEIPASAKNHQEVRPR